MPDWLLQLGGRLHPLVLHLPIGILAALVLCEVWYWITRRRDVPDGGARAVLAWSFAVSAALAALTGLLLAREPGYGGDTLAWHKWLGVGLAVAAIGAAFFRACGWRRLYAACIIAITMAMIPAGHLGGTMTHGADFLTKPLKARSEVAKDDRAARRAISERSPMTLASTWAQVPKTVFADRCVACHGPDRRKGGLALHDFDAVLRGGESGAAVVAGDPSGSELLRRMRLPLDHEQHMPPAGKPQPTPREIQWIADWIAGSASEAQSASPSATASDGTPRPIRLPDAAVAALKAERVHVEVIDPATGRLWIDFRSRPKLAPARIERLLAPVAEAVGELSLAGTLADDDLLTTLPVFPALARLDLSGTRVSANGIAGLAANRELRSLNLTRTGVGDAAIESLLLMPLEAIFVWETELSPAGIARLRAAAPSLRVTTGAPPPRKPLETEPPLDLGEKKS